MSHSRLATAMGLCLVAGIAAPPAFAQTGTLTIDPDNATLCPGASATFLARKGNDPMAVDWSIDPAQGALSATSQKDATKYTAPAAVPTVGSSGSKVALTGVVTLTATVPKAAGHVEETATARITLAGLCQARYGGELTRATIGFEQVGAAGTASEQKYSFDMFISRPLPIGGRRVRLPKDVPQNEYVPPTTDADYYFGPHVRWWGDVRIGSYPQQINSNVAAFTKDFAKNAGNVPVNQLVQSAEFITGPEVRIAQFPDARDAVTDPSRQRFALMAFAGIGSIGPFPPGDDPAVFAVPDGPVGSAAPSPQYTAFHGTYPVTGKYVSFVPENRHQFSRQWNAGLRLYTFYADQSATSTPLSKAPATVEIAFGRNDLVAPGRNVWHASAYYPFALGDRTKADTLVIYFFGDAHMRFSRTDPTCPAGVFTPTCAGPLFLAPAVDASNAPIPLTNKDVSIVSVAPNERDTYRVGVSVDLIRIWNKLTTPTPPAK